MDKRLRFAGRLLDGEKVAPRCREFGISRKAGYKFFARQLDFENIARYARNLSIMGAS